MNEAKVTNGCFVVACCQAARAFEFVEAALDTVPQGIGDAIDEDGLFSVDLAGNNGCSASLFDPAANVIAVVSTIRDEDFRLGKLLIDQRIKTFEIRHFTATYLRPDRQSVSVGNEVDLGREATF